MGLFKRRKPPSVLDRFPKERLQHLPTLIAFGAPGLASSAGLDAEKVWVSRFFCGYLIGYPSYLDGLDRLFGAAIRKILFATIFGEAEGDKLHQRAMGHLMLMDQQTRRGTDCGERDDTSYFKALEERRDATESTATLKTAFDLGLVDLSQGI